jgi:hypothetical protein
VTSIRDLIDAIYGRAIRGFQPSEDPFLGAPPWVGEGEHEEAPLPIQLDVEEPYEEPREGERVPFGRFPLHSDEDHSTEDGGQEPQESNLWESPLGRDVTRNGIEALAWYVPFHNSRRRWGIYFRETGLLFLADYLESAGIPSSFSLIFAYDFLDAHEQVHGIIEAVGAIQELIGGSATYLVRPKGAASSFRPWLTIAELEEALGNSYAVSRRALTPARSALEGFAAKFQPAGYRDWKEVAWWQSFNDGANAMADQMGGFASLGPAPWLPYLSWSRSRMREIPRYLVRDAKMRRGIIFGFRHDGVEVQIHFSNEHPPPHFHVRFPPRIGHDRAYTYPEMLPAREKDPPLNSRQRRTIKEAIGRYPRSKFETEFERHRKVVAEKSQSLETRGTEKALREIEKLREDLTEDQYRALKRRVEEQ